MRPCRGRCPSDGLCGLLSGWLVEASFSPDGKEIVFRLETGTGYALPFIDRDGGEIRTHVGNAKPRFRRLSSPGSRLTGAMVCARGGGGCRPCR